MATAYERSSLVEASDTIEAIEECYRLGWSDGLPVVPPADYKVQEMLRYVEMTGEEELLSLEMRRRVLTSENAAANAVMAGCLPEYFPCISDHPPDPGGGEELRPHGLRLHQLPGHPDDRQWPHPKPDRGQLQGRPLRPRFPGQRLLGPRHSAVFS